MKIIKYVVSHWNIKLLIICLGWGIFGLGFLGGSTNVYAQHFIKTQYQGRQQQALVTNVNRWQVSFFTHLMQLDPLNLVFNDQVKTKFDNTEKLLTLRDQNAQEITNFYAGKYYANGVTKKKLDHVDQNLLQEKNQTIYQKQKNKLDQIRIWFDQTHDAQHFLAKTYHKFVTQPQKLNLTNVSEANAYYKLIKNKASQKKWRPKVKKMLATFKQSQQSQSRAQLAKEKAQLTALQNAPLTTSNYTPANVTIIDDLQQLDEISSKLQQAGIKAQSVLFYSSDSQTLTLVHRSGSKYVSAMRSLTVRSGSLPAGSYQIEQVITNPGDTAGVVTDKGSANFGQYYADATKLGFDTNSTSDFNQAKSVFWLQNNAALQTSLLVANNSNLGFISSATGLANNLSVSSADINSLLNNIANTSILYVD
ncbi:hypothetical protein [Bombilactobacillus thymidiniphilus]|uniref:Uncharacterized protein n=1 Tax=Bombilactobacillus thymidiniphilus TaxID=2923363 RepID=A0ABY4PF34_9LACO|nr:hypothetical protein [Bombilactobacillus thymidiniphilus]UQS84314.1 hypothetical protein MOO47_03965 [Bombilactobacillus thymidiniphilus]